MLSKFPKPLANSFTAKIVAERRLLSTSGRPNHSNWAVAWDMDRTLYKGNYYGETNIGVRTSVGRMREVTKELRLERDLYTLPRLLMQQVAIAGGMNCIITANPIVHLPIVVLETMGFSAKEISNIPIFISPHNYHKNYQLSDAQKHFKINSKSRLALVDDRDFNVWNAEDVGHPVFRAPVGMSEALSFQSFVSKMCFSSVVERGASRILG